ncbi:helix-turn-helix transcriptional regulator [Tistlia consotensis]|uniref:helix-turn-helix transcriptional regulator n=1 Tax=Tistlia consotensis TaxID=1321365 RepID=UPI003F583CBD
MQRTEERRALAAFVRDRRARTRPEEVGLSGGPRRRTPGLRREEVALLAGIGLTWYTWFEQGRDIQVSTAFLERLARALRLDRAERIHLFSLAQRRPPPHEPVSADTLPPAIQRMLDGLSNPAYVKNQRWDVLGWNAAAALLFEGCIALEPGLSNIVLQLFGNPRCRRRMIDWEGDARRALAKFRLDYGRAQGDPAFEALVEQLEAASPEFRRWWPRQDVSGSGEGIKRFDHETLGELEFEHTAFLVESAPDLRLVVYTPI